MKFIYMLIISGLLFSGLYAEEKACEPFVPPLDEFDWIQLTSGEWLKGELKALYNEHF